MNLEDMTPNDVEQDTLGPKSEEVLMVFKVDPFVPNPTSCQLRPTSETVVPSATSHKPRPQGYRSAPRSTPTPLP